MARRLALRPLENNGEHHAPRYSKRDEVVLDKTLTRLKERLYEVIDLDTGEVLDKIEI